jgi:hypothetical protein
MGSEDRRINIIKLASIRILVIWISTRKLVAFRSRPVRGNPNVQWLLILFPLLFVPINSSAVAWPG